jgi:hypothetical protein
MRCHHHDVVIIIYNTTCDYLLRCFSPIVVRPSLHFGDEWLSTPSSPTMHPASDSTAIIINKRSPIIHYGETRVREAQAEQQEAQGRGIEQAGG